MSPYYNVFRQFWNIRTPRQGKNSLFFNPTVPNCGVLSVVTLVGRVRPIVKKTYESEHDSDTICKIKPFEIK